MGTNSGNVGLLTRPEAATVRSPRGARQALRVQAPPAEGVTVCVPGAVLAPAPTPQQAEAGEAPVFVDDSGNRKRLLRLAGVLIALLSVGFLAIVGVALAVPDVATSVGLGDVVPFIVPGAAAVPPVKAPPAPHVQVVKPRPKPRPPVVAEHKPAVVAPVTKPAPVAEAPVTEAPAPGGTTTGTTTDDTTTDGTTHGTTTDGTTHSTTTDGTTTDGTTTDGTTTGTPTDGTTTSGT